MIFLHQANDKMDEAIVKRFFELYNVAELPANVMPMNISYMGNSSVATVPTLLHQVLNKEIGSFVLNKGDLIMFASVGAGMNINAITYRW
jgi:3-oxoacyl-[acyl-carrier-protein] synthase-3